MRRIATAALISLALATPGFAQLPNVQQMLQGLSTGNQSQDHALQEAFERGYQRGRQDEAQRLRSADRSDRRDDRTNDRRDDNRAPYPTDRRSGSSDYNR